MIKQFATIGGGNYIPVGDTCPVLPAGYYTTWFDHSGTPHIDMITDYESSDLIHFEDSSVSLLLNEFERFWGLKDKYLARSESHKRGFLLWGPPGSGKSCILDMLVSKFIADDGLVFDFTEDLPGVIQSINTIDPDRRKLFIFEDFDRILGGAEHEVLQLMDGLVPLKNTVCVATTNYPERIPARFLNRPSRFDRIEFVGFPSLAHRLQYIEVKSEDMSGMMQKRLAKDTENFTFAHLKEAILSIELFGTGYQETIDRIRNMQTSLLHSSDYSLLDDEALRKASQAKSAKELAVLHRRDTARHLEFEEGFEDEEEPHDYGDRPSCPQPTTAG